MSQKILIIEDDFDMLSPKRARPADEICSAIFSEVFRFRGSAAAFDDISVLVMRCQDLP